MEHAKLLVLLTHHLYALQIHLLLVLLAYVPLVLFKVCDLLKLNWLVWQDGLLQGLSNLVYLCHLREVIKEQLLLRHVILVQNVWIVHIGVLEFELFSDGRLLHVVLQVHVLVVSLRLSLVETYQVLSVTILLLGNAVHWLVSLVYTDKLFLDEVVVRHILVLQFVQIVEDVFDFDDVLGLVPQKTLGSLEAASLDVLYFLHGVLFDLSPNELLI